MDCKGGKGGGGRGKEGEGGRGEGRGVRKIYFGFINEVDNLNSPL